jgi:hypothetical protein
VREVSIKSWAKAVAMTYVNALRVRRCFSAVPKLCQILTRSHSYGLTGAAVWLVYINLLPDGEPKPPTPSAGDEPGVLAGRSEDRIHSGLLGTDGWTQRMRRASMPPDASESGAIQGHGPCGSAPNSIDG